MVWDRDSKPESMDYINQALQIYTELNDQTGINNIHHLIEYYNQDNQ